MPSINDPLNVFTRRVDDYSDEFAAAAFASRWQLSGGLVYTLSSGRARVVITAGGSNDGKLSNLTSLPDFPAPHELLPDANTIGLYHLDDDTTIIRDSSGNGNHATPNSLVLRQPGIVRAGAGLFGVEANATTDYLDVAVLAGDFDPTKGSIDFWFRAALASMWSDGATNYLCHFFADATNNIIIANASTNLTVRYTAGGVTADITLPYGSAGDGWHHYAVTWDVVADQFKAYIDGVQFGTTQTGLGTWAGALTTPKFLSFESGVFSAIGFLDEARVSDIARPSFATTLDTDLEAQWETSWTITTDFAIAGQEATEGLVMLFADGSTERHLLVHDGQGFADARAEVLDEGGSPLGSNLVVSAGTDLFFRVVRKRQEYFFYARQDEGDAWTLLHQEWLGQRLVGSEFQATRIGAAAPAWDIEYSHDNIRRVQGYKPAGSTLDISYAFGTVGTDDDFLAILDKLKPSGLKIEIVE